MAAKVGLSPNLINQLLELDAEARAFAEFAERCEHRIINGHAAPVCWQRKTATSDCSPEFCPLFKFEKGEEKNGVVRSV